MPSLRSKKNRFRKSLNTRPPASSSKFGARELLRRRRGAANRCASTKRLTPELVQRPAVHLGEADLQHDLLALVAAGHLQHVDDVRFDADASAISPARSMTFVLETLPDRMVASSLVLTSMSSPGNSVCRLLLQRGDRRLDDQVVLGAAARCPRRSG